MSEEEKNTVKSPLPMAIIVGGFIWIVSESLLFGALAGFLTLILMKRDAREDEDHDAGS